MALIAVMHSGKKQLQYLQQFIGPLNTAKIGAEEDLAEAMTKIRSL
jgi:hypothetical protein